MKQSRADFVALSAKALNSSSAVGFGIRQGTLNENALKENPDLLFALKSMDRTAYHHAMTDSNPLLEKGIRNWWRGRNAAEPFDPNAQDGDGDGSVQDNTRWQRPAVPGKKPQFGRRVRRLIRQGTLPPDYGDPRYEGMTRAQRRRARAGIPEWDDPQFNGMTRPQKRAAIAYVKKNNGRKLTRQERRIFLNGETPNKRNLRSPKLEIPNDGMTRRERREARAAEATRLFEQGIEDRRQDGLSRRERRLVREGRLPSDYKDPKYEGLTRRERRLMREGKLAKPGSRPSRRERREAQQDGAAKKKPGTDIEKRSSGDVAQRSSQVGKSKKRRWLNLPDSGSQQGGGARQRARARGMAGVGQQASTDNDGRLTWLGRSMGRLDKWAEGQLANTRADMRALWRLSDQEERLELENLAVRRALREFLRATNDLDRPERLRVRADILDFGRFGELALNDPELREYFENVNKDGWTSKMHAIWNDLTNWDSTETEDNPAGRHMPRRGFPGWPNGGRPDDDDPTDTTPKGSDVDLTDFENTIRYRLGNASQGARPGSMGAPPGQGGGGRRPGGGGRPGGGQPGGRPGGRRPGGRRPNNKGKRPRPSGGGQSQKPNDTQEPTGATGRKPTGPRENETPLQYAEREYANALKRRAAAKRALEKEVDDKKRAQLKEKWKQANKDVARARKNIETELAKEQEQRAAAARPAPPTSTPEPQPQAPEPETPAATTAPEQPIAEASEAVADLAKPAVTESKPKAKPEVVEQLGFDLESTPEAEEPPTSETQKPKRKPQTKKTTQKKKPQPKNGEKPSRPRNKPQNEDSAADSGMTVRLPEESTDPDLAVLEGAKPKKPSAKTPKPKPESGTPAAIVQLPEESADPDLAVMEGTKPKRPLAPAKAKPETKKPTKTPATREKKPAAQKWDAQVAGAKTSKNLDSIRSSLDKEQEGLESEQAFLRDILQTTDDGGERAAASSRLAGIKDELEEIAKARGLVEQRSLELSAAAAKPEGDSTASMDRYAGLPGFDKWDFYNGDLATPFTKMKDSKLQELEKEGNVAQLNKFADDLRKQIQEMDLIQDTHAQLIENGEFPTGKYAQLTQVRKNRDAASSLLRAIVAIIQRLIIPG